MFNHFRIRHIPDHFVIHTYVIGSIQLFFIGLLGEYILNINTRVIHRPLVVEEKRINFGEEENKDE